MATGSRGLKLLLDETIGQPIAGTIFSALGWDRSCAVEFRHMRDFLGLGAKDPSWVVRAASEGWFVITGDRGEKKDGAPLDLLLPYHGVSAAFMTGALHGQRKQFEKMRAIIALWPQIKEVATGPLGKRYKMRIDGGGFALVEWPLDERAIRRQQEIFQVVPQTLFDTKG